MSHRNPVRIALETLGLAALIAIVLITYRALHGSMPLPERIPTHFSADGQPNAWGPAASLWLLPGTALAVYALMSFVSRFPASFNFPVRVTRENRLHLEGLALRMLSWLKMELVCLFLWIQWQIIHSVLAGSAKLSPWMMPVLLLIVFGTVAAHLVAIIQSGASRPVIGPRG